VEGFEFYAKSEHPFTIVPHGTTAHFPVSHSCAMLLSLPAYETKEHMKEKLIEAINSEGFHVA
jgi:hypothetical protein